MTTARNIGPNQETRAVITRLYASGPVDHQHVLVEEWTAQYGADTARWLMYEGISFVVWPEDVTEFRAFWSDPSVRDAEIRQAVATLTDDQLKRIGELLRQTYLQHPDEVGTIWQLAIDWAAEA